MVIKRNLLIVTFSYLNRGGGGIESWLQKFLSNVNLLTVSYDSIEVIGLADGEDSFSQDFDNTKIKFQLIEALSHKSLLIFPKLVKEVKNRTSFYSKKGYLDTVFIGSNFSAFPILFYKKNKSEKRYIWLRSFFPKEIYSMGLLKIKNLFLYLEHLSLKKADKLIANGFDTKKMYEEYYCDLPEIVVIPNAVEKRLLHKNINPLENEVLKIAFIGRLEKIKGFDSFCCSIEIFNKISICNLIEFYIIGYGSLEKDAISLQNKYENVHYLGKMNNKDIYTFISAIDCSVNLTICTETMGGAGLSNSLLESIFSNNLIIAWNTVNFNQILNDESAFLVTQNDIDSLVDVYKFILNNRDDCKKKIKKAESIVQEFDFEHHMLNFSNFVIGNE